MTQNAFDSAQLLVTLIPLIFAVTIHEFAHGYVAYLMGDDTARLSGRLTLNPIRHIDPLGSVILPLVLYLTGSSIMFGWAKPVPVNFLRLKDYRKGVILVSAAGVMANLACAVISGIFFRMLLITGKLWFGTFLETSGQFLVELMMYSAIINLVLMIFNLIPVPPLDGSKILAMVLPDELSIKYQQMERYGMFLIIVLLMLNIPGKIINFLLRPLVQVILGI